MTTDLAPIPTEQLTQISGGFDWSGLANGIAGLVDQHAGTNGEVSKWTSGITSLVGNALGDGGGR